MSQLAPTIPSFTDLGATRQETTTTEKIPMVVSQRHKPATSKKRTSKQEDSDDYEGNLNEPVAYRPHLVTNTKIRRTKYSTSLDSRGYIPGKYFFATLLRSPRECPEKILEQLLTFDPPLSLTHRTPTMSPPVYEFTINEQPIMWDRENGYVHFTGIWKALGNNKADIARLVDTHPDLASTIKKVRGGFLKIQGTWMPHDKAHELCRRTCYHVREELIPLFGPSFPSQALDPTQPGFGRLTLSDSVPTKKRQRRKPKETRVMDNMPPTSKGKTKAINMLASPMEEISENSHDVIMQEVQGDDGRPFDHYHQNVDGQDPENNHRHLVIFRKQKRPIEDTRHIEEMVADGKMSKRRRQNSPENGSLGDDENSSTDGEYTNSRISRRGSDSAYSSSSQRCDQHHQFSPVDKLAESQCEYQHSPYFRPSPILPDSPVSNQASTLNAYTPYPPPTIHPSPLHQPPSPLTEHDLYEAINATVALQQLSQDNGTRPLQKDQISNAWPRNFIMGNREFQFIGCRYRVVRYW
ncbi:5872_t:CDS:2 [Acaulospora colombiana]|uniref:5872_t:CDS:1 n=1 Tax=Acaulospora colombiana TaxID=27376 RepID=A0ACA9ML41_9GLOM|nr:5872_t:CDS:2 [Acaulospora colombiana]